MPILNYTTKVPARKTVAEVSDLLARKGAASVTTGYDTKGRPTSISFVFTVGTQPMNFALPVNIEGVSECMGGNRTGQDRRDQAERVAWRIVKDWVEAQLAIVESSQAQMGQVFLPYAVLGDGRTAYDFFVDRTQNQLGSGGA